MKISVIIPTFNRAHTLQRAIDSVLSQTYKNFELIIVDDGSTDKTNELLQGISDDRVHFYSQKNLGVSAARNLGAQKTNGELISFLDSDDEWLPHKLEEQIKFYQANPKYRLVHGEEIWIRRGKRVNQKKKHQKSGGDIFERSLELCLISPSAVMMERTLYDEMKGFDEDFIVCEDYDLWLKITSKYEVGYLSDPVIVKYGGHDDQLSAKYRAMDYWRMLSMSRFLNTELERGKRISLSREMIKKGTILITGYKKHNNLDHLQDVERMVERAQTFLNEEGEEYD